MSCIYSTLRCVCAQAKEYNVSHVTPIVTFDQPLWWKSLLIIEGESQNSDLRALVLRLGSFHTEMSFLGCIGHLMAGTGLEELLALINANNAVVHMLTGKAIACAVRGRFLVDTALNTLMVSKRYNTPLPQTHQVVVDNDQMEAITCPETTDEALTTEADEGNLSQIHHHEPDDISVEITVELPEIALAVNDDLHEAADLYDKLMNDKSTADEAQNAKLWIPLKETPDGQGRDDRFKDSQTVDPIHRYGQHITVIRQS